MRRLSDVLKAEYGEKVYKLALSSGCTCPNRDGKIAYGGCAFCSAEGSGDFAAPLLPLDEQIEEAFPEISCQPCVYEAEGEKAVILGKDGDLNEAKLAIGLQSFDHVLSVIRIF